MKTAFSDYDGTLSMPGVGVSSETIEAIRAWRAAGNAFGIVTGRDHSLIRMETDAHAIPVDFLICANGASLHDAAGRSVARTLLPHEATAELLRSRHIRNYRGGMLFFTTTKAYVYRHRDDAPASYLTVLQHPEDALILDDVVQMGLEFSSQKETLDMLAAIEEDFPSMFSGNINRGFLDLNAHGVSKCAGIDALLRIKEWTDAEVFVIGDDRNDLPMIEAYGGYTVETAKPFMHDAAHGIYSSVGAMLRDKL